MVLDSGKPTFFSLGSRHSIFKSGGRGKYFAIHWPDGEAISLYCTYLLKSVVEVIPNIPARLSEEKITPNVWS